MRKIVVKSERKAQVIRAFILVLVVLTLMLFLKGAKFALLVLAAAIIHETGHIIFAKLFRVELVKAKSSVFGMWFSYDFSGKSYLVQIIVSCAGAFFNVVCAGCVLLFTKSGYLGAFFVFSNLALALFNLMPVSRFDGIGVLRCLILTMTGDPCRAEKVCRGVSVVFSAVFFLFSVYVQMRVGINMPMLTVSVFLLWNCLGDTAVREREV